MGKERLEAFIITIMVLELHAPEGNSFADLKPLIPKFISYILSFLYIAISWNNHHHLFQAVTHVNGKVLWWNTLLLLCLSLVPFVTPWMGENHFSASPVALYGLVLLRYALVYPLLLPSLIQLHDKGSLLAASIGKDAKGKISIALYVAGILLSFFNSFLGFSFYCCVAVIWFIPDRRIEKKLLTKRSG